MIYYVDAVTTDNGGTSGGLCFLVPTNSAAVVQRSPVTFVLGGIAYLDISFLGLELRVWNVYLSAYATTRSKQIKEWAKVVRSCGDSDRIHTVLGDLNVDPAGDKDHAQWEDLLAITNFLAGCQVALDGAAYGGVAGGANSTIDHAFASMLEHTKMRHTTGARKESRLPGICKLVARCAWDFIRQSCCTAAGCFPNARYLKIGTSSLMLLLRGHLRLGTGW